MNKNQIIVFLLENKYYGIEIMNVIDIYEKMESIRVPNAESYIDGIINLRSDVITLINLKERLKVDKTQQENNVIICEYDDEKFGLIVDEIYGIVNIDSDVSRDNIKSGFIKGLIETDNNEIMILELKKILIKT